MTPAPAITEATCANCRWWRHRWAEYGSCEVILPPHFMQTLEAGHDNETHDLFFCALHSPKETTDDNS